MDNQIKMQQDGELVLVSRRSPLARRQAQQAADALQQHGVAVRLVGLSTRGDETPGPLAEVGGKDLFVDRLRQALLNNEADAAVHSLKDMTATPSAQFTLAAIGFGEDRRDVVVSADNQALGELPNGATVGTCGPRRIALLRRHFPHLTVVPMRGNIHSRLQKLKDGDCTALLLAAAGLHRMGLQQHISEYLPPTQFIPAVGQGLLGIECPTANPSLAARLGIINDATAHRIAVAERAFAAAMNGDCHTPLAAHATLTDSGQVHLRGFYATTHAYYDAQITADDAATAGQAVAEDILQQIKDCQDVPSR